MLDALPFGEIWILDTEFGRENGDPLPTHVCCVVARELRSGRRVARWLADGQTDAPYDTGPGSLFVAHFSPAEWLCHMKLGWPVPLHVVDTYVEARAAFNGLPYGKAGLLETAARLGIPTIATAAKDAGRSLAMRGPPWSPEERERLINYCASDVDTTADVFLKILAGIVAPKFGLQHALIRGRFMRALAYVEREGIPIDGSLLARLQANWGQLKLELVERIDAEFGCYDGTMFKRARFEALLDRLGLLSGWPRTPTGRLSTEASTFKRKADAHPALRPLYELSATLGSLRKLTLPVGSDGRHRAERLGPFGTNTGRMAPSGFVFAPARWVRHLIKPERGRALVYSDYVGQELHVAARLSGDQRMLEAVESGDPYLWFAKEAGLAPADATKASHATLRAQIKVLMLGTGYGMSAHGIAATLQISLEQAEHVLLARHKRMFPAYWAWSAAALYSAIAAKGHRTRFGWPLQVTSETMHRSLLNHPIQSAGADILRLAAVGLVESGVSVNALIHDAVLTECPATDLREHVQEVQRIMRLAAKVGIGAEVPVDSAVCRWPDRFVDERGVAMFATVVDLLTELEARARGDAANGSRAAPEWSEGSEGSRVSEGSTVSTPPFYPGVLLNNIFISRTPR